MPDRIGELVVNGSPHESDVPLVIYNCKNGVPARTAFSRNADLVHFLLR